MGLERLRERLRQVLKIQIIFFFRSLTDQGFWKERKADEVGGDETVAEENGKCLYCNEEVEEMEKMKEWFSVRLTTIAKYFLDWGIK